MAVLTGSAGTLVFCWLWRRDRERARKSDEELQKHLEEDKERQTAAARREAQLNHVIASLQPPVVHHIRHNPDTQPDSASGRVRDSAPPARQHTHGQDIAGTVCLSSHISNPQLALIEDGLFRSAAALIISDD